MKSQKALLKTFLRLHWYVCSLGLIGIMYGLSWKLHAALLVERRSTAFYDWALPFFFPHKPQQILFFIGTGAGLFIYYAVFYFLTRRESDERAPSFALADLWSLRFIVLYIILPVGVNAAVVACFPSSARPRIPFSAYLLMALWLSAVALPFYPSFDQLKTRYGFVVARIQRLSERIKECLDGRTSKIAVVCLIIVAFLQVLSIFLPFLQGELLMMNEFMDVSEQSLMGNSYVSNTEYINAHELGGLLKYEPKIDRGGSPLPRKGTFVEMPRTTLLEDFIQRNKTKYAYSQPFQALVIHGAMTVDERTELSAIVDYPSVTKVIALYHQSRDQLERIRDRTYTAEELEFLSKNHLEMRWQILNRWVIHHHKYVLGPINEYA
jgi:hypothetical protein